MPNKLTKTAKELLEIESDLPHRFDFTRKAFPTYDDFEIHVFEQTWGSTALGFDGIVGLDVLTTARTYVFVPICRDESCYVYFAGKFAYAVPCSEDFMEDVLAKNMASVRDSTKYLLA